MIGQPSPSKPEPHLVELLLTAAENSQGHHKALFQEAANAISAMRSAQEIRRGKPVIDIDHGDEDDVFAVKRKGPTA